MVSLRVNLEVYIIETNLHHLGEQFIINSEYFSISSAISYAITRYSVTQKRKKNDVDSFVQLDTFQPPRLPRHTGG